MGLFIYLLLLMPNLSLFLQNPFRKMCPSYTEYPLPRIPVKYTDNTAFLLAVQRETSPPVIRAGKPQSFKTSLAWLSSTGELSNSLLVPASSFISHRNRKLWHLWHLFHFYNKTTEGKLWNKWFYHYMRVSLMIQPSSPCLRYHTL